VKKGCGRCQGLGGLSYIPAAMPDPHQQQMLQLFVRHQARVKGFIVSLLPDFAAADDVLQETFLVVQRKADARELSGESCQEKATRSIQLLQNL
jgi:sigma-70-like protein